MKYIRLKEGKSVNKPDMNNIHEVTFGKFFNEEEETYEEKRNFKKEQRK